MGIERLLIPGIGIIHNIRSFGVELVNKTFILGAMDGILNRGALNSLLNATRLA